MSPVPMCLLTHLFILAHPLLSISFLPFPFVSSSLPLFLIEFPFFPKALSAVFSFEEVKILKRKHNPIFYVSSFAVLLSDDG